MINFLSYLRFFISAAFIISGLFMLISSVIGVYKFKYVLNRMHSCAMGDTLGLMYCLLGVIISADDIWLILKLLLVIIFLWTASPVSSHLISRLELNTNPIWEEDIKRAHQFIDEEEVKDGLL